MCGTNLKFNTRGKQYNKKNFTKLHGTCRQTFDRIQYAIIRFISYHIYSPSMDLYRYGISHTIYIKVCWAFVII